MRTSILLWGCLLIALSPGCATTPLPSQVQGNPVICRLATRATGTERTITLLAEANLDPWSGEAADRTVEAVIHDGRLLSASVRHVDIRMPRERFNVAMTLNNRPLLRLNHMDLDIYLETSIDGQVYLLHCLRDNESPFSAGTDR